MTAFALAASHAVAADTQALVVGAFTAATVVWGAVLVLSVRARRRRATPPPVAARPVPVVRRPEAPPTQRIPVITNLPERPAPRAMDDTAVFFRVLPEDPTVFIPRQRGARHAR